MRIEIACIDVWGPQENGGPIGLKAQQQSFAEVWIELYQVLLRWNPQKYAMPGMLVHFAAFFGVVC